MLYVSYVVFHADVFIVLIAIAQPLLESIVKTVGAYREERRTRRTCVLMVLPKEKKNVKITEKEITER